MVNSDLLGFESVENKTGELIVAKTSCVCAAPPHTSSCNQRSPGQSARVPLLAQDGHLGVGPWELLQEQDVVNGHRSQAKDVYVGTLRTHGSNLHGIAGPGQLATWRLATRRRSRASSPGVD